MFNIRLAPLDLNPQQMSRYDDESFHFTKYLFIYTIYNVPHEFFSANAISVRFNDGHDFPIPNKAKRTPRV